MEGTATPWMQKMFGYRSFQAGLLFLYIGAIVSAVQGFGVPRLSRRYPAQKLLAGGRIMAGSVKCRDITVGGTFEAGKVKVGEKVAAGRSILSELTVGGQAEIDVGSMSSRIKVGGAFASKSQLKFGEISILKVRQSWARAES